MKGGGWVLNFVTCLQIFFLKKPEIHCSFLQMEGVEEVTKIGHFLWIS